jgi:hypothetical protein
MNHQQQPELGRSITFPEIGLSAFGFRQNNPEQQHSTFVIMKSPPQHFISILDPPSPHY